MTGNDPPSHPTSANAAGIRAPKSVESIQDDDPRSGSIKNGDSFKTVGMVWTRQSLECLSQLNFRLAVEACVSARLKFCAQSPIPPRPKPLGPTVCFPRCDRATCARNPSLALTHRPERDLLDQFVAGSYRPSRLLPVRRSFLTPLPQSLAHDAPALPSPVAPQRISDLQQWMQRAFHRPFNRPQALPLCSLQNVRCAAATDPMLSVER